MNGVTQAQHDRIAALKARHGQGLAVVVPPGSVVFSSTGWLEIIEPEPTFMHAWDPGLPMRHAELVAQATRVQVRPGGLVTDYFGVTPERQGSVGSAIVVRCVHGKEWPEGGLLEDGTSVCCQDCLSKSRTGPAA